MIVDKTDSAILPLLLSQRKLLALAPRCHSCAVQQVNGWCKGVFGWREGRRREQRGGG